MLIAKRFSLFSTLFKDIPNLVVWGKNTSIRSFCLPLLASDLQLMTSPSTVETLTPLRSSCCIRSMILLLPVLLKPLAAVNVYDRIGKALQLPGGSEPPFKYLGLITDFNGVDVHQYNDRIVMISVANYIDRILCMLPWLGNCFTD
eukprot:scaffold24340_cov255-Cylindrotheca_fusiformis.AAC.1